MEENSLSQIEVNNTESEIELKTPNLFGDRPLKKKAALPANKSGRQVSIENTHNSVL
jgi:hypothetical protein